MTTHFSWYICIHVKDDSLMGMYVRMYVCKYTSAFSFILTSSCCFTLNASGLLSLSSPFGDILLLHIRPFRLDMYTYMCIPYTHISICTYVSWQNVIDLYVHTNMKHEVCECVLCIYIYIYNTIVRLSFILHIYR